MAVKSTGQKERLADYYNGIYNKAGGYDTARFDLVYDTVMRWLSDDAHVLECGSGTGVLASRIINAGIEYRGFDFSYRAQNACPEHVQPYVTCDNAYYRSTWCQKFNTVVAIETFEHLDDLCILRYVPAGTRVIFSVPDFNTKSHLRVYPDVASIIDYYDGVLDIVNTVSLTTNGKTIIVCDSTRRQCE